MVVDNSHVNEETKERAEKEISKNTEQWRAHDKQEKPVHRGGEEVVSSSNKERKNELLETTLHHNDTQQPLEWSLQTRSRENKRNVNTNHATKTGGL